MMTIKNPHDGETPNNADDIKNRFPMYSVPRKSGPDYPTDDAPSKSDHTEQMTDITREEFNAKLETMEVKMDARVESVSSKIEGFLAAQAERDKRFDAVLAQISKDHSETRISITSMKTTLIVTAVSTVIAIVLGVAGFNTSLTSNMISAFQLGKADHPASEVVAPAAPMSAPSPQRSTQK